MKINSPKEKLIFIELSGSDMKKLNLSFEEMDYSDEETRRAIFSVLNIARESLDQHFELSDTAKVEALPRENGGCLLFFTIQPKKKRFRVQPVSDIMYASEKIDTFFDLASAIDKTEMQKIRSSLYYFDGIYYLRLTGRLHHSLVSEVCEYAEPVIKGLRPCEEALQCLINESALEILCGGVPE